MYDLSTMSALDTFSGRALSGPLHDADVRLTQLSVVTSTWAAWKAAHPDTTIVAQDGGLSGERYPLDPLRGRDDHGPIFPVGDVDSRLPVQERVLGVIGADGQAVAFPVANALLAIQAGEPIELAGGARGARRQRAAGVDRPHRHRQPRSVLVCVEPIHAWHPDLATRRRRRRRRLSYRGRQRLGLRARRAAASRAAGIGAAAYRLTGYAAAG